MLEVGIKAPDFELPDQNGKIHRLSDYTGKKVILYFSPVFLFFYYPKSFYDQNRLP